MSAQDRRSLTSTSYWCHVFLHFFHSTMTPTDMQWSTEIKCRHLLCHHYTMYWSYQIAFSQTTQTTSVLNKISLVVNTGNNVAQQLIYALTIGQCSTWFEFRLQTIQILLPLCSRVLFSLAQGEKISLFPPF